MVKKITPDPPPSDTASVEERATYLSKLMHEALTLIDSKPPSNFLSKLLYALSFAAVKPVEPDNSSAPPLFSVQPGVNAKAALTQVSQLLKSAELNADEICPRLEGFERDLLMGLIHSVTLSRTVVDALLDGTATPSHT
ncbi:DUF6124 family protein [Pseudomonas gingeri]|uniref:Uncharacterized protein n=1 Tax=Pseudomonas gingeri TaxID=117681 RepID=A0A7Y7YDB4_9PSED|nr:hypothetical protein [Pseudomonas gingeri]NWB28435.1 hypothetical protein [Pseudomonas gingeri]NWC34135.1 hypothetical protein [Pseudomonas gingeri]NWD51355.1 hypothetical protein [Pseudomonas gingeri]